MEKERNKKELRDSWKVKVTYSWVWEFPGKGRAGAELGLGLEISGSTGPRWRDRGTTGGLVSSPVQMLKSMGVMLGVCSRSHR